ncbi:aspartic peptidase domain-containing protein [Helicostylum pulchrum]|nr:aspartic peptidase domain-containing protein [Helicostylum pulchrum]
MQNIQPWTSHLDLFGSPECDYHAKVTIGSTLMNLVLDTGSSNTAVISDLCQYKQNCSFVQKPHLHVPVLNAVDSVNASYGNAKLRSAWKGFSTEQLVSLQEGESMFARVDVISENQSFFIPRCAHNQGIWGLAHASLQTQPEYHGDSLTFKSTLFDTIRKQKGLPNAFTYQICPKSAVDSQFAQEFNFLSQTLGLRNTTQLSKPNQCMRQGHFWLGGYPSQSVGSEIVWVPLMHQRYYQVTIESFLVNNQIVEMEQINLPRTIVDTGTKDIVLSRQNLQKLLNALWHSKLVQFDASVSNEHEKSFWFDHAELTIPRSSVTISSDVSLQIAFEGNKKVSIPIENILNIKPFEEMKGWVKISWTGLSSSEGKNMASTILGNTLLRGKTVIFDRGQKDAYASRIGFTGAAGCCRSSSGHDVNILLSVDNVSKAATLVRGRLTSTMHAFILLMTMAFLATFQL